MIGEEIDADAERLHAAEQRGVGHLAVLQRVAMIRPRHRGLGGFDGIERQFGRLVAIGVDVELNPGLVVDIDDPRQFLRRDVPQAVGRTIVVARPTQPRGEALDRAVDHELDDAVMQLVVIALAQARDLCDRLFRRVRHRCQRRHQPNAEVGLPGGLLIKLDRMVDQVVVQVGDRGHALDAGGRGVALHIGRREVSRQRIAAERTEYAKAGRYALQLAARQSVLAGHDAGNIGRAQQFSALQHDGVDVTDVEAGMNHHDRPRRRDAVEILPRQHPAADMQRIEAPGKQRHFGIFQRGLGLLQTCDNGIDIAKAGDHFSPGRPAIEGADIGQRPHHAFHDVAVSLDETGQQDFIAEAVIGPAEPLEFSLASDRNDTSVAHGHMSRKRTRRIHRDDLAGRKDDRVLAHVKLLSSMFGA